MTDFVRHEMYQNVGTDAEPNFVLSSPRTSAKTVEMSDGTTVEKNIQKIGDLTKLNTNTKEDLVSAVNEVFHLGSDVKTGLVTALLYSDLGITSEMSWDEIFTVLSEEYPEPPNVLVIFDGGLTREGDEFKQLLYSTYDEGHKNSYLQDGVLYGETYCLGYDRVSYAGGLLTLPVDITNYTKLHVEVSNSVTASTEWCAHSIGLSKVLVDNGDKFYADMNTDEETAKTTRCTLSNSHITEMDLTEYKNTFGNTGYFIYSVQKDITGGQTDSMSNLEISKVWFS